MVVNNPHELRGKAVSSRGPLNKAPSIEQPASAEQLAKTLHDAATQKLAVIPVGGGRARGMGDPASRADTPSCDATVAAGSSAARRP